MEKSSWRNVLGVFVLVHIICSHFMISIFDMSLNAGYLMTFLYACAGFVIFRSGHQIMRIIQLGSMVSAYAFFMIFALYDPVWFSQASEAAAEQGKFWEMHDLLLDRQDHLLKTDLLAYAEELGLDVPRFGRSSTSTSRRTGRPGRRVRGHQRCVGHPDVLRQRSAPLRRLRRRLADPGDRHRPRPGPDRVVVAVRFAGTCSGLVLTHSPIRPRKWARNFSCSCRGYVACTVSTRSRSKSAPPTHSATRSSRWPRWEVHQSR